MNSKVLFVIFSLTLLLSSCGGFEKEKGNLLSEPDNKDLVNSFNIGKDQAELFKEEKAKPEDLKKQVEAKVEVPKKGKKTKNEKVLKKEAEKTAPLPATSAAGQAVPADVSYPADYPQLFKNYDVVSKNIWEKFKPLFYQGEQSIMAIYYLGVTAGYITITSRDVVMINDKMAYHYFARFKSKDAYRYFYWLDDNIETFVEKSTFLPMKYQLIQREKNQDADDLELFDYKKLKTYHWYKRVKKGSNKDEKIETYIPRFVQDSFSALQFVRGLPLQKGDRYDFPVVTRGKAWLLKVEVMGEEMTSVNDKEVRAHRLKAETHFPGVLQKRGDINFWYSADESKKLLKFQAKIKIGSIYGELIEHKPGVLIK